MRYRALATDFDGTLAAEGAASAVALEAIGRARERGMRIILVTGRILSELLVVFPDVFDHVDLVVAENGAVIATPHRTRLLHPPVDPRVERELAARRVRCRAGQVIIACSGLDEASVVEVVRGLGLECELLRNRHELMVLPTGVTKGAGLIEALADLGLSAQDTIGVGDAENDHSLLETVELGVAVANAIPSLAREGDLVLDRPNGAGLADLLDGEVVNGSRRVHPKRWRLLLGVDTDDDPVTIPASQVNVVIAHDRKYARIGTDAERAFHFRDQTDHLTGATASSLSELRLVLARCPHAVLRHHSARHDLSRWVADVFHDGRLAFELRDVESRIGLDASDAAAEAVREGLLRCLAERSTVLGQGDQ